MPSRKRKPLLSSTRPPTNRPPPTLSSRITRTLIRTHHTLRKKLFHALATHDESLAASLRAQIAALGGLPTYQQASVAGQSAPRGGDSSKVLVEWLAPLLHRGRVVGGAGGDGEKGEEMELRMLEVGALKVDNACTRSGLFEVERIDLRAREKGILEQDFMARPMPSEARRGREGFDVVSLSLVVNFVGDAAERGEMLRRVGRFLRMGGSGIGEGSKGVFPGLFLVLPAPCVANSRYLNEEMLEGIMQALGYMLVHRKLSSKLVYYYWRYCGEGDETREAFGKEEIRSGKGRNNFAIVLR